MKKIIAITLALLLIALFAVTAHAVASDADGEGIELEVARSETDAASDTAAPDFYGNAVTETPGEPLTWAYLATIAGAAAATLLVVQFCKIQLDKVWKIPTRLFVYIVALVFMLLGTSFTTGLTLDTVLLTAVNALVASITAYGAYEVTFKNLEIKNN